MKFKNIKKVKKKNLKYNKISSTFFESGANGKTSNTYKTKTSRLGVNKYMENPKYNDTNSFKNARNY